MDDITLKMFVAKFKMEVGITPTKVEEVKKGEVSLSIKALPANEQKVEKFFKNNGMEYKKETAREINYIVRVL